MNQLKDKNKKLSSFNLLFFKVARNQSSKAGTGSEQYVSIKYKNNRGRPHNMKQQGG